MKLLILLFLFLFVFIFSQQRVNGKCYDCSNNFESHRKCPTSSCIKKPIMKCKKGELYIWKYGKCIKTVNFMRQLHSKCGRYEKYSNYYKRFIPK